MPSFFSLSVSLQRKQTNKQAKHAAIAEIVQELTALLEAGKDVNLNALKQEVIESLFFSFPIKTSTASRRGKNGNLKTSTQPKKKIKSLRPRPATPSPRLQSSSTSSPVSPKRPALPCSPASAPSPSARPRASPSSP